MNENAGFHVSRRLVSYVAGKEGFKAFPYRDSGGVWTIGHGFTNAAIIEKYRATGITFDESFDLMVLLLDGQYADVVRRAIVRRLTQAQFDALTDVAFNLGGKYVLRLAPHIDAGDLAMAAELLRQWDHDAEGTQLPGLTSRRAQEIAWLFEPAPRPVFYEDGDD